MFKKIKKRNTNVRKIRNAINSLPCGLCFYRDDGVPILTNMLMNEIAFQITGKTIADSNDFWEQAYMKRSEISLSTGNRKLKKTDPERLIYIILKNNSIWQLRRTSINTEDTNKRHLMQLDAVNVTELYNAVSQYNEMNVKLVELYQSLKKVSNEAVHLNSKREQLHVKSEIHDEFGDCIAAAAKMLENDSTDDDTEMIESWERVLSKFSDIDNVRENERISPEKELKKAADIVNCRLHFENELPESPAEKILICAAVREALINAVRHANADTIRVAITEEKDHCTVRISSNGNVYPKSITEGTGLGNLRSRLLESGAALEIICDEAEGVILVVRLVRGDRK